MEVISGVPLTVTNAFFVGPIIEILVADTGALQIAGASPIVDVPQQDFRPTIPFKMRGIPPDATVGLFWLSKRSNGEVWTNAGVRIVSTTRETLTAEIPRAHNFTVVAYEAHDGTASAPSRR